MSEMKKVVVTGAAGTIAGLVLPGLRERYDVVPVDVNSTNRQGDEIEGIQIADLLNRNRDTYRPLFAGADAVAHFGFVWSEDYGDPVQRYRTELSNVDMAFNIFQVSLEENVRRVVMASSNHAADYYEPLILADKMDVVTPDMRALSDNYYGWAKESYEHLGFVFATGVPNGRPLENVQIRIGGPRETDVESCKKGDIVGVRRALGAYISQRDLQQLFIKSIETEGIHDENGVPFQIFYGVSGNSHNFWSIANARKVIDYEPQDNSEIRFCKLVQKNIEAALEQGCG